MKINNYVNYFRSLAMSHTLLGHDQSSETHDSGAVKHFAKFNSDEIITGLRTKVAFPAMLVELFELNGGQYRGSFMLADHAIPNNFNDEQRALDITEELMDFFRRKIYQDVSNCVTPFEFADMMAADIISFGPIWDNEFGWRCEFGFRWRNETALNIPL